MPAFLNHQESTARQYALVDYAVQLGWPPDQVEIIDEDQGITASTAEGRFGRVLDRKADFEVSLCQNRSGQVLDDLVVDKLLQALEPAALELSLLAAGDLEQERQRLDQNWQQRLERSRYVDQM